MDKAIFDLTGAWLFKEYPTSARRMRDLNLEDWFEAKVPSSIFTSLIQADKIDQTDLMSNPENYDWISEKPWIYKKIFDVSKNILNQEKVELVCQGLDTVTQIWLNEKLIGKTESFFLPYRFDATEYLKRKNNILLIKFTPAAEFANRLMDRYGQLAQLNSQHSYRSYIRKPAYQFGSDSSPALPGCGVHRPIYLEGITTARIEDVFIRTIDCNQHYADVGIVTKIFRTEKGTCHDFTCCFNITGGGLDEKHTVHFDSKRDRQSTVIRIERPIMWWPRPYGVQHLYKMKIELLCENNLVDEIEKTFGIRTVRLRQSKDSCGNIFQFEFNGRQVYVKGANWLPVSMFPGSNSKADYENLLTLAVNANINMLRVRADGYYENTEFYNLCDRLGIMVWQDFMFDSAYYPDRQWFTDSIKSESSAIIKRLRNHPCLTLWCGNNQVEHLHATGRLGKGKKFYGREIYHSIIPQLLNELEPDHNYIPTTPFSKDKKDANYPQSGSSQSSICDPLQDYIKEKKYIPRFITEFGTQSLPSVETIRTFCPNDQFRIASHAVEKHNYQIEGNSKIMRYIAEFFGTAANLQNLSYLSQLTQARIFKSYSEHLRANNKINNGQIFRNLNDCFGTISFSAIDYIKIPKALFYYVRRSFAPQAVVLVPELSQNNSLTKYTNAVVLNDSPISIAATLIYSLLNMEGDVLDEISFPVVLGPFTTSTFFKIPKDLGDPKSRPNCLINLKLKSHDKVLADNNYLSAPDKYIHWLDPQIHTKIIPVSPRSCKIILNSGSIAKDVQIIHPPEVKLSDNFIDLLPGQKHTIKVTYDTRIPNLESCISTRSVNNIFSELA